MRKIRIAHNLLGLPTRSASARWNCGNPNTDLRRPSSKVVREHQNYLVSARPF